MKVLVPVPVPSREVKRSPTKLSRGSSEHLPSERSDERPKTSSKTGNVDSVVTQLPSLSGVQTPTSVSGHSTRPPASHTPAKEVYSCVILFITQEASLLSDEEYEIIPIHPPTSVTTASQSKREPKEDNFLLLSWRKPPFAAYANSCCRLGLTSLNLAIRLRISKPS